MRKRQVQAVVLVCAMALSMSVSAGERSFGRSEVQRSWWDGLHAVLVEWWGAVSGSGEWDREAETIEDDEAEGGGLSLSTQDGGPGACQPGVFEESCSIDPDG